MWSFSPVVVVVVVVVVIVAVASAACFLKTTMLPTMRGECWCFSACHANHPSPIANECWCWSMSRNIYTWTLTVGLYLHYMTKQKHINAVHPSNYIVVQGSIVHSALILLRLRCYINHILTIRYDTIVAWCTLKYKIKNRPVAYYRVSKSYVVLGNARVKK